MLELPDFVVSVDPGLKTGLSVLASEDGPRLCASAEVDVLEVESWLVAQMGMIRRIYTDPFPEPPTVSGPADADLFPAPTPPMEAPYTPPAPPETADTATASPEGR